MKEVEMKTPPTTLEALKKGRRRSKFFRLLILTLLLPGLGYGVWRGLVFEDHTSTPIMASATSTTAPARNGNRSFFLRSCGADFSSRISATLKLPWLILVIFWNRG
jgi:hypothetical protein